MPSRRAQFPFRALLDYLVSGSASVVYVWSHFLRVLLQMLAAATMAGLSAASVAAQGSPESAPSPPNTPPSLQSSVNGYGNQDKLCLAWNDGCVTCLRDATAGAACSNVGIACQPKEITCTQRQTAPAK